MTGHASGASRRAYYNRTQRATIARSELGHVARVVPPDDVERREFSGPCRLCEARGECRHRRSWAESFAP